MENITKEEFLQGVTFIYNGFTYKVINNQIVYYHTKHKNAKTSYYASLDTTKEVTDTSFHFYLLVFGTEFYGTVDFSQCYNPAKPTKYKPQ